MKRVSEASVVEGNCCARELGFAIGCRYSAMSLMALRRGDGVDRRVLLGVMVWV